MSESNYENIVPSYYDRLEVQKEITKFSQKRWVALHCQLINPQGYPVLLRYQRTTGKDKVPLTISKPEDVPALLNRFKRLKPRTFYASISVYKELTRQDHVKDLDNIMFCSPVWDIGNTPEKWKATLEATEEIIALLRKEGVSKSVFLKWSGKGAHVHIHHEAFSRTLLQKIAPLNVAYAIVEYVNQTLGSKFAEIAEAHNAPELSVENETDLQRVVTCPLSLHRSLNSVAVCIPPAHINDFTLEWTRIEGYRHWEGWDRFESGEADALAEKAYHLIGGYTAKVQPETKPEKVTNSIIRWLTKE